MRVCACALACSLFLSLGLSASEEPDFSGVYVQTLPKPRQPQGKASPPARLRVVQHGRVLEATFTVEGKTTANTYYLDGTYNSTPGGASRRDIAKVTGHTLLIDSTIRAPQADTTLHMKQRWQLSPDRRRLIIRTTVSAASERVTGFPLGSWEKVYRRQR